MGGRRGSDHPQHRHRPGDVASVHPGRDARGAGQPRARRHHPRLRQLALLESGECESLAVSFP